MSLASARLKPAYDAIKTLVNISGSQGLLFDAAGGALTNGRSSTATIEDFEGVIRDCKVGEIRYANARRVENLVSNSSFATNLSGWIGSNSSTIEIANPGSLPAGAVNSAKTTVATGQTGGSLSHVLNLVRGRIYRFSIFAYVPSAVPANAASLAIYYVNVGWSRVAVPDSEALIVERDQWVRKSVIFQASSTYTTHVITSGILTLLGSPGQFTYANLPLLEEVTYQTNKYPSEYIDSYAIYNAGVPGVKYFDYQNGNTVTDGVVTEAHGAALSVSMLCERGATNLISKSVASTTNWIATGATPNTNLALGALGRFPGVVVKSAGQVWHRLSAPTMLLNAGAEWYITAWYSAGTSGRARIVMRDITASVESIVNGPVGNLVATELNAGTATVYSQDRFGDVYRVQIAFTPLYTTSQFELSIGPDSSVSGESIIALGAQMESGIAPTSYIYTNEAAVTRDADKIRLPYVPDGNLLGNSGLMLMKFTYGVGPTDNDQGKGIFTIDNAIAPIFKSGASGGQIGYQDKNAAGGTWDVITARNSSVFLALYWSLREGFTLSVSTDGGAWQHHTIQPFAGMPAGNFIEFFKNSAFTHNIHFLKIYSDLPGKSLTRARTWVENNAFAQVQ